MLSRSQTKKDKLRVRILGNDNIGWSIDTDRKNVTRLLSTEGFFEVVETIFHADVLYSVWYNLLERPHIYYPLKVLKKLRKMKVIATVTNEVQNTPDKISRLRSLIDIWIAPSKRTFDYLKSKDVKVIHIPFLVDKAIFKNLNTDKKVLADTLGIGFDTISGKTLIGSFQRDSLGSNLSMPKWQKNPDLLIEILKNLPKEKFILLLAGPRRHYVIGECKKFDIPYLFIGDETFVREGKDDIFENNLPLERVNLLYNLSDVCLVTSKSEGGPKAVLECALTKTLVFSTDVGLARDILHGSLIYSEIEPQAAIGKLQDFISGKIRYTNEIQYNHITVTDALNENRILDTLKKALYEN